MTNKIQEYFWDSIKFPLKMSKYHAKSKTLKKFYKVSLKYLGSGFYLHKFEIKNEDIKIVTTFKDGICQRDNNMIDVLWTLPWFSYKVPIGSSTSFRSKSVSSVVDNSLILLYLQGIDPMRFIVKSNSSDSLWGYDYYNLVMLTRHLLSVCCFFFAEHKKITKDEITIDRFLWLCAMNFLQIILCSNDIDTVKKELLIRVIECNRVNVRLRYGKSKNKEVTVTLGGNLSKGKRHSISMKKYGEDVEKEIYHLRYKHDYSVRQITEALNDKGITISKSTVDRIIKKCPADIQFIYTALRNL